MLFCHNLDWYFQFSEMVESILPSFRPKSAILKNGRNELQGAVDQTRSRPNRVAAYIQGNGGDDNLVKTGFRIKLGFRMNLRFRMNLGPTPHMISCLFWLFRTLWDKYGVRFRIKLELG